MSETFEQPVARILIVDDNEAIHADFRKILGGKKPSAAAALDDLRAALFQTRNVAASRMQYEMHSAFQGQEAAQKVRQAVSEENPYALAFVDMRMPPGWDGLETIEHLWREDPDLQVVICTAYSDYSWEEMRARLGQSDGLLLLKKPFDNAEISQLACALTEKWRLARQAQMRREELERMIEERTADLRSANETLQVEISQRESAEERLRHDALHDPLTDLANRVLLIDRMTQCIEGAKRRPDYFTAVLFLDIDNFKVINDSLGHHVGDQLLISISRRLTAALRSLDTVTRLREDTTARLGGDEFIVLLDGIKRPSDAVVVAERLQKQLASPFELEGHEVCVGASIGIAVSTEGAGSAHDMLRDADTAMYRAKHAGKGRHAVFDANMHVEAMARLELENSLRSALERQQFHLMYQPILSLETGQISSFEALLRWEHPQRGYVSPAEFIPVAEEIGLIIRLGRWVLQESCRQLIQFNREIAAERQIALNVNVSGRQLGENSFCQEVAAVLRETGIEPGLLNLEITETAMISARQPVVQRLHQLKQMGVRLHMDDFGTGYSSLNCLHRFPLDVLKIDRAFVTNMERDRDYTAIVRAIITLAKNLKLKVTAEGMETKEQLAQILSLDCDFAQGYYFSKPLDAAAAQALLLSPLPWLNPIALHPAPI